MRLSRWGMIGAGIYILLWVMGIIYILSCSGFLCGVVPAIVLTFPWIYIYAVSANPWPWVGFGIAVILNLLAFYFISLGLERLFRKSQR